MVSQLQRRHRREYEKICEEYGATMTLLREDGGHLVYEITQAEGTSRFVTSASPSDRRSHKNNRAKLRRILRHGEPPEPVSATPTNGASHGEEQPAVSANGHGDEAPEPAAAEPEQPQAAPMTDLAQAVAAQLESQVEAAVQSRVAGIVGELDVLMEERSQALLLVAELDDKIAKRLRALSEAAVTPPEGYRRPVVAQTPRPPEPEPVAPPPPSPPPLPPAEAEPEPEPEPADAQPVRTLKAQTMKDALVEIAEANGGILHTRMARELLIAEGRFFAEGKTTPAARISSALYADHRFEKGTESGEWRLIPDPRPAEEREQAERRQRLQAAVLEFTKDDTEPFTALAMRDRLQSTTADIGPPREVSIRLSRFFASSPHFEKLGRGRWRRVSSPATGESAT